MDPEAIEQFQVSFERRIVGPAVGKFSPVLLQRGEKNGLVGIHKGSIGHQEGTPLSPLDAKASCANIPPKGATLPETLNPDTVPYDQVGYLLRLTDQGIPLRICNDCPVNIATGRRCIGSSYQYDQPKVGTSGVHRSAKSPGGKITADLADTFYELDDEPHPIVTRLGIRALNRFGFVYDRNGFSAPSNFNFSNALEDNPLFKEFLGICCGLNQGSADLIEGIKNWVQATIGNPEEIVISNLREFRRQIIQTSFDPNIISPELVSLFKLDDEEILIRQMTARMPRKGKTSKASKIAPNGETGGFVAARVREGRTADCLIDVTPEYPGLHDYKAHPDEKCPGCNSSAVCAYVPDLRNRDLKPADLAGRDYIKHFIDYCRESLDSVRSRQEP